MENSIVKKSNDFVEAAYHLSLMEMRVLVRMLSLIHVNDEDFCEYEININEFKNYFGIENEGSVYQRVRESCLSLMDKKVVLLTKLKNGLTEETTTPIVIGVTRTLESQSTLKLSFHPKMKPYLLQLKNKFLVYNVNNVLKLSSSYAVRIYELCKQYANLGKRKISVAELKRMLGIEKKYKQYTHLRQRILDPSVESINQYTDIWINYEPIKKGRKVDSLHFTIKTKSKGDENAVLKEEEKEDALLKALKPYNVSAKTIKRWRSKYSDEHIIARINYMAAQEAPIENPGGYLNSLMGEEIQKPKKVDMAAKIQRAKAILYSRPNLETQIRAKHGNISEERLVGIVQKMFPDKFVFD